jgi:predicted dehydrogenase
MTAADQIAVTGTLPGGAVITIHYRGGSTRATNFHWEINGTDGDLVVISASGHLQFGQVTIFGANGSDAELSPLTVPESYHRVAQLADHREAPSYAVAHAYVQFLEDLDAGTSVVPDFDHGTRRHRTLHAIQQAAATGTRQAAAASS